MPPHLAHLACRAFITSPSASATEDFPFIDDQCLSLSVWPFCVQVPSLGSSVADPQDYRGLNSVKSGC
ncbi:hypothetical protein HYQ45_001706 [Verticillium longisporum]|uniref:Uncharacterized protein n=1 Tax=Verticillium longisporum TaxID=100787 RepID=A0A8I2ZZP8_VERLO|nr:hypothetical protein HYQ45_001706 [Verticillium longisporum]KAG7148569.1 hypothetical protein HYQ46_002573 [Verticillium longisporum]